MQLSNAARYTLGVCAAVTTLVGCGTSQISLGPREPMGQNAMLTVRPDRARSWMAPDAKKADLLYISDLGTDDVYVYSYPEGVLKGTLTGFNRPWGLCVDKAGKVFVTDEGAFRILEYAHGGTKPLATLKDPGEDPGGCSVDPTTGDLAVANISTPATYPGDVAIYKKARGTRKTHKDPQIIYYEYCGYDNQGNLYVDGMTADAFAFAELPKGKALFANIGLNENIRFAGGVQWDGHYVAIRDYEANVIYQFSISGSSGTETGSTSLGGSSYAVQFWIHGSNVIGPNADSANVMFWNYPAGGSPTKTIDGLTTPWGVTVSMAG
ncbi:MAG: hypothetical protein ABSD52_09400 [Candidatus Cybelea sp.]